MLHQPHAVRFGALALIVVAGLLGAAAAARGDLWMPKRPPTATPRATPSRGVAPAARAPATPRDAPARPTRTPFTVTAVVALECPQSLPLLEALAAFRARHPDVAVEALLAAPPPRGARWGEALVALTQPGIPLGWTPARLRRLAPPAVPAVYVLDTQGRGVQAAGVPPLEELVRVARETSYP